MEVPWAENKKFIEKYAPELAQKEETLTVKAGDHVSNHVHGAGTVAEIGEQEGTVVYTNLAQIEPKQQIHGHIVGASGVTACEQGLVNSVYVEQGRHQYVTKVRTRRAKARTIGTPQTAASVEYTVIATNRTKRTIEKGTLMAEMSASPELSAQSAAALKRIMQTTGKLSNEPRWIRKAQARRLARRPHGNVDGTDCARPNGSLRTEPGDRAGSLTHPPPPAARRYRTRGESRDEVWDTND